MNRRGQWNRTVAAAFLIVAIGLCLFHSVNDDGMSTDLCTGMLASLTVVLFVALAADRRVLPELVPVVHPVPIHLLDPPPRFSRS